MLRRIVWQKFGEVSEVPDASIIRAVSSLTYSSFNDFVSSSDYKATGSRDGMTHVLDSIWKEAATAQLEI